MENNRAGEMEVALDSVVRKLKGVGGSLSAADIEAMTPQQQSALQADLDKVSILQTNHDNYLLKSRSRKLVTDLQTILSDMGYTDQPVYDYVAEDAGNSYHTEFWSILLKQWKNENNEWLIDKKYF